MRQNLDLAKTSSSPYILNKIRKVPENSNNTLVSVNNASSDATACFHCLLFAAICDLDQVHNERFVLVVTTHIDGRVSLVCFEDVWEQRDIERRR